MMANAVGNNLTETELAYCAGFIDADGAIMASIEKHGAKKYGFRVRVSVKITQRDIKVAQWFLYKFKIGRIKTNRFSTAKTSYEWEVKDQKHALIVLEILEPYLRFKKKQAQIAITILKSEISSMKQLIKVANLADKPASFNVRSKLRRKNFASSLQ